MFPSKREERKGRKGRKDREGKEGEEGRGKKSFMEKKGSLIKQRKKYENQQVQTKNSLYNTSERI